MTKLIKYTNIFGWRSSDKASGKITTTVTNLETKVHEKKDQEVIVYNTHEKMDAKIQTKIKQSRLSIIYQKALEDT